MSNLNIPDFTPVPEQYIFCQDFTMSIPLSRVQEVVEMWEQGKSIYTIAEAVRLKPVEAAVMIISLEYDGKIQPRKGGLMGSENNHP